MKYSVCIIDEDGNTVYDRSLESDAPNLLEWWVNLTVGDFELTTPKIHEYGRGEHQLKQSEGSADLRLIGENIAELIGIQDAPSALKQELGAWFYLQGKVARCVANYKQGLPAKADTLLDSRVYSVMMTRLQETGNWP